MHRGEKFLARAIYLDFACGCGGVERSEGATRGDECFNDGRRIVFERSRRQRKRGGDASVGALQRSRRF